MELSWASKTKIIVRASRRFALKWQSYAFENNAFDANLILEAYQPNFPGLHSYPYRSSVDSILYDPSRKEQHCAGFGYICSRMPQTNEISRYAIILPIRAIVTLASLFAHLAEAKIVAAFTCGLLLCLRLRPSPRQTSAPNVEQSPRKVNKSHPSRPLQAIIL